jgi:C-terminal processing protease CtpA/Prc
MFFRQIAGSPAELDGRLQKGDFIVSVDGKDLSSADHMTVAATLKLCGNKTNIKVKRFKVVPR